MPQAAATSIARPFISGPSSSAFRGSGGPPSWLWPALTENPFRPIFCPASKRRRCSELFLRHRAHLAAAALVHECVHGFALLRFVLWRIEPVEHQSQLFANEPDSIAFAGFRPLLAAIPSQFGKHYP